MTNDEINPSANPAAPEELVRDPMATAAAVKSSLKSMPGLLGQRSIDSSLHEAIAGSSAKAGLGEIAKGYESIAGSFGRRDSGIESVLKNLSTDGPAARAYKEATKQSAAFTTVMGQTTAGLGEIAKGYESIAVSFGNQGSGIESVLKNLSTDADRKLRRVKELLIGPAIHAFEQGAKQSDAVSSMLKYATAGLDGLAGSSPKDFAMSASHHLAGVDLNASGMYSALQTVPLAYKAEDESVDPAIAHTSDPASLVQTLETVALRFEAAREALTDQALQRAEADRVATAKPPLTVRENFTITAEIATIIGVVLGAVALIYAIMSFYQ